MRLRMRTLIVLTSLVCLGGGALWGSGGSSVPEAPPPQTPEEQARERYNQGLSLRDSAWRLEKKLASPLINAFWAP